MMPSLISTQEFSLLFLLSWLALMMAFLRVPWTLTNTSMKTNRWFDDTMFLPPFPNPCKAFLVGLKKIFLTEGHRCRRVLFLLQRHMDSKTSGDNSYPILHNYQIIFHPGFNSASLSDASWSSGILSFYVLYLSS